MNNLHDAIAGRVWLAGPRAELTATKFAENTILSNLR